MTVSDEPERLGMQIVTNLARADVSAEVVPWHGAVIVHLTDTEHMVTGYSSWDYGAVERYDGDMFQPTDETMDFGVTEDCEDPLLIAAGIARAVDQRRSA